MAVTNLYSNLPGHLVEFKDGGLQLTTSTTDTSSTKSLLILGTATDGPINEPVKIDSVTVSQVFGKEVNENGFPNGATITKYAKQAFKNGFDDVRCMRITGSQAYTEIEGEQLIEERDASSVIDGAQATDETGKVLGNAQFSYDFTSDPEEGEKMLVARGPSAQDHLIIRRNENSDGIRIDLDISDPSTPNIVTWRPYRGFSIKKDTYPMIGSLETSFRGYEFLGDTALGDFLKTKDLVIKASVTVESQPDPEDAEQTIDVVTAVSAGGNENDKLVTYTDAEDNTIVASLFKDKIAHETEPNLVPSLNDYDNNGFIVKKADGTIIDPSKYTLTVASDGTVSITFDTSVAEGVDGIVNDDNITVTYIPYKEVIVNKTFTQEFNETVPDSSISLEEMEDKSEASIVSVRVGNQEFPANSLASVMSIEDGILKIIDTSNMNVGDVIKVTYKYKEPINSKLKLKVKSQWGGSIYNGGTVNVKKQINGTENYTIVEFTRPEGKTNSQTSSTFSYSSQYYKTVDDLILAMKNDVNNLNLYEIEIVEGNGTDSIDMLVSTSVPKVLANGSDGLKPDNDTLFKALSGERYTMDDVGSPVNAYTFDATGNPVLVTTDMVGYLKTQGAYQILENYNVDYIYPAGVYADAEQTVNPNSDFQRELALVCAVLTYRTKMTHGFIDVKPNSNTTLVGIDAYVSKLINGHSNLYYMTDQEGNVIYDADNKPMDIGWYTSVVVGPEPVMTSDTLGTYYGSPAIAYAALNSVLEPQSSPLNKALRNVNGMKFKFSNKQMDAIIGNRMVCFKLKNEGMATASSTPYVVDGVTSGAPGCDYSDIAIVKVVTDVVDNIRKVADPFIGEQNTVEQRNALSALISKRLSKLVELGEIQSYEFEVSATIQQQLIGEASIALTIVPAMTLKKITTVVALRAAE